MPPDGVPPRGRVLIVEDDPAMAVALDDGFRYEGWTVLLARDGPSGLRVASESDVDLVILDVMLPRMSGLEILKQLRTTKNDVPVIVLTARGQETDKVEGLRLGADDYVTKPFSFLELMARVQAVLRRAVRSPRPEHYRFADVEVDFQQRRANRSGRPIELSAREFAILEYLIARRGELVTREQLLRAVWGYESLPYTRTVDVHIAKLRRKIEADPVTPAHIVTEHGAGYRFTG